MIFFRNWRFFLSSLQHTPLKPIQNENRNMTVHNKVLLAELDQIESRICKRSI